MVGEHKILLLAADPSEKRPGIGAVDMAFVINIKDGQITQLSAIYPSFMSHPTASPPSYLKNNQGVDKLYLHDALWYEDSEVGAKLAQEIVEYNTGIKTDLVVIVTPEAVDAMLNSIGPVYVPGQGYFSGNSIDLLREEQGHGISRGKAAESLMKSVANATKDRSKYLALIKVVINQYYNGNIVVVPESIFLNFMVANGFSNL